jgi:RNA polymerase subunit RPABC4/transcription elongation factor Spt4
MELTTYYECACAHCGEVMEYRSSQAGQAVECPNCKEQSLLPEAEKLVIIETHGPPAPKAKICPDCGTEVNFWKIKCPVCEGRRKTIRTLVNVMACIPVAVLVFGLALLVRHIGKNLETVRAKTATQPAAPPPEVAKAVPPTPHILIEQPRPRLPKSRNDLQARMFRLERSREGDLVLAVGDIENISDNSHGQLKADVDVLDKSGVKIGEVSDFVTFLGPHQSWHFLATVTKTNANSLTLAGIHEE